MVCAKILLDKVYYGSGYLLNGFMVLDIVNVFINNDTSIYVVGNSSVSNDNESVVDAPFCPGYLFSF